MKEINWKEVADLNGLSAEEFQHEIFTVAACLGVMKIDKDEADTLKFTCSDSVGKIELYIKRSN